MDTESNPRARHSGGNPVMMFITSLSAAIVVAGGFGIIIEAFVVAGADLFQLGRTFVMVMSVVVACSAFGSLSGVLRAPIMSSGASARVSMSTSRSSPSSPISAIWGRLRRNPERAGTLPGAPETIIRMRGRAKILML